jgi:hypothetical protein
MGDIAYDIEDNNGEKGNNYFRELEPVISNISYMYTPGNHEAPHNFSA